MEKSKLKITNSKQFQKLVQEMEKNPELARGFRRGTVPNNFKEQWESITIMLNALGPPKRYGDGWQKIWRDLKCKVKRKLVVKKAKRTANGGRTCKQLTLTPLEESVSNLLQFQKQINVESAVQEVERKNLIECEFIEKEVGDPADLDLSDDQKPIRSDSEQLEAPPISRSDENRTPLQRIQNCSYSKKIQSSKKHYDLFQKHSKEQARLLAEITNSLSSVKQSLKDVNKYHKEMLAIKKKELQLAEEKNVREKEMHEADMKIKRIELAIKKKEVGATE